MQTGRDRARFGHRWRFRVMYSCSVQQRLRLRWGRGGGAQARRARAAHSLDDRVDGEAYLGARFPDIRASRGSLAVGLQLWLIDVGVQPHFHP